MTSFDVSESEARLSSGKSPGSGFDVRLMYLRGGIGEKSTMFMDPSASATASGSLSVDGQPWRGCPARGRPHVLQWCFLRGVEVGVVAPEETVFLMGVVAVERRVGGMVKLKVDAPRIPGYMRVVENNGSFHCLVVTVNGRL